MFDTILKASKLNGNRGVIETSRKSNRDFEQLLFFFFDLFLCRFTFQTVIGTQFLIIISCARSI